MSDFTPGKLKSEYNAKKKKNLYWFEWKFKNENGKWQGTRTKKCNSYEEAVKEKNKSDKARARGKKRENAKKDQRSISTCIDDYMASLLARPITKGFSASTRRTRYTRMQTIKEIIDVQGLTLENIDDDDISRWQLNLEEYAPKGKLISNNYFNSLVVALNSFIDYLNRRKGSSGRLRETVKSKPKTKVNIKKQRIDDKKWTYLEEEYWDLMTQRIAWGPSDYEGQDIPAEDPVEWMTLDQYKYAFLNVMYWNGLRFEEIRPLTWGDLPQNCSYLDINKANNYRILKMDREEYDKRQDTKNETSNRKIPTDENSIAILQFMHEMMVKKYGNELKIVDKLVFPSRQTKSMLTPSTVQAWIDGLTAEASLPHLSIHSFRHSFAMRVVWQEDMPLDVANQFMGHKNSNMLKDIYAKREKEKSFQQMERWKKKQLREKVEWYLQGHQSDGVSKSGSKKTVEEVDAVSPEEAFLKKIYDSKMNE